MKTALTLCLLLGFATVTMANANPVLTNIRTVEDAQAAQAEAIRKGNDLGVQVQTAAEEARIAKESNDMDNDAAYEPVASALLKAKQAYVNVIELYAQAIVEFSTGNSDQIMLKVLLAEAADGRANDILAQAVQGLTQCKLGDYTGAVAFAKQADQLASLMPTNVGEGGEGEAGAGIAAQEGEQEGEQEAPQEGTTVTAGVSTITSPVMQSSPSAFSGSGGRPTASGF